VVADPNLYLIQSYQLMLSFFLISYVKCEAHFVISEKMENDVILDQNTEGQTEDLELPLFDLSTVTDATNNFSGHNKLGEGGFGPVFRVTLQHPSIMIIKKEEKK